MKTENELNDLINDYCRDINEGSDSDFFVDEIISEDTICLNVHVGVLQWMNENIEPHKLMFEFICKYIFKTQAWVNTITSPFGDRFRTHY
jgi:hypothetical protein